MPAVIEKNDVTKIQEAASGFKKDITTGSIWPEGHSLNDEQGNESRDLHTAEVLIESANALVDRGVVKECPELVDMARDRLRAVMKLSEPRSRIWNIAKVDAAAACTILATWNKKPKKLHEAVKDFNDVLDHWDKELDVWHWALAQQNLGITLTSLAVMEGSLQHILAAVMAFKAAGYEYERNQRKERSAICSYHIGVSQLLIIIFTREWDALESAKTSLEQAITILDQSKHSKEYARAYSALALALRWSAFKTSKRKSKWYGPSKVDKPKPSVPESRMTEDEEVSLGGTNEKTKTGTDVRDHPRLRDDFTEHGVASFAEKKIPEFTPDDIVYLEKAIRYAQNNMPKDKTTWAEEVSEMLRLSQYRILLEDGSLANITVKPGKTGKGFIQFSLDKGGSCGGFKDATIKLIPVPKSYVGNKHRHQAPD